MDQDDEAGDKDMLVYSWAAKPDWEWDRSREGPVSRPPPADRVFVIQAKAFTTPDKDGLAGAVLHWTWIAEDPTLLGAPINSASRFTERVWTKRRLRQ